MATDLRIAKILKKLSTSYIKSGLLSKSFFWEREIESFIKMIWWILRITLIYMSSIYIKRCVSESVSGQ